jgi:hypothetical protein
MWKGAVMAGIFLEGLRKMMEVSGYLVSEPRFEPVTA